MKEIDDRITELCIKEKQGAISTEENEELEGIFSDDVVYDTTYKDIERLNQNRKDLLRSWSAHPTNTAQEEEANRVEMRKKKPRILTMLNPHSNTYQNRGPYSRDEIRAVAAASNERDREAPLEKPDGRGRIGSAHWGGGNKKVTKKNRRKNRRYSRRKI